MARSVRTEYAELDANATLVAVVRGDGKRALRMMSDREA